MAVSLCGLAIPIGAASAVELADVSVADLVDEYCISCHNETDEAGGLALDFDGIDNIGKNPHLWEDVVRKLRARQMPPIGEDRPTDGTYAALTAKLTDSLDKAAADHPTPGRTETFRRLNRTEYQNAIRDLLGLEIDAASLLPPDEASHGFDNVTVGDLPPTLLTRYVAAARKISRIAVGSPTARLQGHTYRIAPDVTQEQHVPGLPLGTRGGTVMRHTFPQDGEYEIAVNLARDRNEHVEGLHSAHELIVVLNRGRVATIDVRPPKNKQHYFFDDSKLKARIKATAGPQSLGVTFVKKKSSLIETKRQPLNVHFNVHRHPRLTPAIYQISVTGPFAPNKSDLPPDTPSRRMIFTDYPSDADQEESVAHEIIANLTRFAYRRNVTEEDVEKPLAFFREARAQHGFEAGIEMAISAILVSPRFLFRIEREPDPGSSPESAPGQPYHVSDFELASRLSFFLWSSLPDDELLRVAQSGGLREPETLRGQVDRMLTDSRSRSLVTNFASQWLYLRNLDAKTPDGRLFPDFDDNLRQAFRQETELFFESIVREDRSVIDLLDADYTFLNERLAKHYGIDHVYGSRFRRVPLDPESHRGGLLRHGSILTVTSYATRTSPVIRGNWVLENILGTPAPPPPPNVPALEEDTISADLPMRQRLARHRADPVCASCHNLMDPVGFALENYDAVGRWRDHEAGRDLDVSGGLPDGSVFSGVSGLEQNILKRPEMFVSTMVEKLLTYALGRGIEHYDAPAVRAIVRDAEVEDYRFSALIWGIVNSPPFQMRTSR
jgi:hypothetical protein